MSSVGQNGADPGTFGSYYEELVRHTLSTVWRRKLVVLATVVATIALAAMVTVMTSKRFAGVALVDASFTAPTTGGPSGGDSFVSVDASLLVETRSRIFTSHQTARRVVQRVGLDKLEGEVGSGALGSLFQQVFNSTAMQAPGYAEDRAAAILLSRLKVKTEPRVYVVTVTYPARDPKLAATVANAFVAEFLHAITVQSLQERASTLRSEVGQHRAAFGQKHPKSIDAESRLSVVEGQIAAQAERSTEDILGTAYGKVTLAEPVSLPTSPDPVLNMGLGTLLGLIAGIVLALQLERRGASDGAATLGLVRRRATADVPVADTTPASQLS